MYTLNVHQVRKTITNLLIIILILTGCQSNKDNILVSVDQQSVTIEYLNTLVECDVSVKEKYQINEIEDGYLIELNEIDSDYNILVELEENIPGFLSILIKEPLEDGFYYEYLIEYSLANHSYNVEVRGSGNVNLTYCMESIESEQETIMVFEGYVEVLPYENSITNWHEKGYQDSEDGYKKKDIYRKIRIENFNMKKS